MTYSLEDEIHQGSVVNLLDFLASPFLLARRVHGGSVTSTQGDRGRSVTSYRTSLTSYRSEQTRDGRHVERRVVERKLRRGARESSELG